MERLKRFKDDYSVRVKIDPIPVFESFKNTTGPKPVEFPKTLTDLAVQEVKKKSE